MTINPLQSAHDAPPGIGASSTSETVRRPDKSHPASNPAAVLAGC